MKKSFICGEAIVQLLEAYGVRIVFGIPGTHILGLYKGLHHSGIRHILARTEQGAGFMADGYARVTGKPGVVFTIGGPGLLNAATPIATAYADSVPLLIISSANTRKTLDKGWGESHEIVNQRNTTSCYTAFSATVHRPGDIPDLLARAFAVFTTNRPRPVHIEIPNDIFFDAVDREWHPRKPSPSPASHPDAIAEALLLLNSAERPVIYVGGGAKKAADEIRCLSEKLAAPVATTFAGMGIMPGSHPLSLGSTISWRQVRQVLEDADVLLAVGTEMASADFWDATLRPKGQIVRVDIDPAKLVDRYPAAVAMNSDAKLAVKSLLNGVRTTATQHRQEAAATLVKNTLAAVRADMTDAEKKQHRVAQTIQASVPADTVYFGDLTQLTYTAYRLMTFETPGLFFTPKGFDPLGHALPASIGAKLGAPDHKIVAIAGDGGLPYNVQEMGTAFEEKIPIILIVWNNRGLAEIRDGFNRHGIEPIAVSPISPNHIQLGQAYGWRSERVHDHASLKKAIIGATHANLPTLIELLEEDPW
jgi:5-guanidino-2-oxopentanoate decarboxylase